MNIWVSKHIDGAKHKDIIIDTLIALKAKLGEKLNECTIWISDLWEDSISGSYFAAKNHVAYPAGNISYRFPSVASKAYIEFGVRVASDGTKHLCAYIDELRPMENVRNIFCIQCLESNTRNMELDSNLFYVNIENRTICIPYNPIMEVT